MSFPKSSFLAASQRLTLQAVLSKNSIPQLCHVCSRHTVPCGLLLDKGGSGVVPSNGSFLSLRFQEDLGLPRMLAQMCFSRYIKQ